MTSSATRDFLNEIVQGKRIPDAKLAYFGATLCNLIHQAILFGFAKAEKSQNLTKRELARRIGKKPEQITRWLAYPGNLTFNTAAEILIGMGIQVENLGLANFASGTRTRFPQNEGATSAGEMQIPIKTIGQNNVVSIKPMGRPPMVPKTSPEGLNASTPLSVSSPQVH